MCKHHHNHHNTMPLMRISVSVMIFILALILQPSGAVKFAVFLSAYLIAGWDVLYKAFKNIFAGNIFDENFLMSIATIGAFSIKEYPEAVMVMVLYQIGEFLQHKAVEKSRHSISELMDIRPDYANIEVEGNLVRVSPERIKIGDIITVKTGEKIPLDGVVTEGRAVLDTSALTGEPAPKEAEEGSNAISGCININGLIKIKVTKEFHDSTVAKILELTEHANEKKSRAENFITKFARYYTPIVVLGAFFLAVLPPLLIPGAVFEEWLQRALTFLVISCPCALVISVPLSFFGGIGGASKEGILIKGSNYIEALANPQTVVFDKTGTLTQGVFDVRRVYSQSIPESELLETAALAENYSDHPIAVSIKKAYDKEPDIQRIKDVNEFAGKGVKVYVDEKEILAGNRKLFEMFDVSIPNTDETGTTIYLAKDREFIGYIVISDEIKNDSADTIRSLNEKGIETVMLTGDNRASAEKTAKLLGFDKVFANLLPAHKVEKIEEIIENKQKNKSIIFVGDGINDAPVLTRSDVGIAMGALGSDAAIEAADVVIMDDKPSKVLTAVNIARKTLRIVKQNIAFAIGIKVLFLALGALGLITMWGAVFADVGVTLIAIVNSLRTLKA